MSKKKRNLSLLKEIDKGMVGTYNSVEEELEAYRKQIILADRIAEKKMKKKMKKNPNVIYNDRDKVNIRNEVLRNMEKSNFVERCTSAIKAIGPLLVMFCRSIAALITMIMSLRPVQAFVIKHGWESKIKGLYSLAMSVTF